MADITRAITLAQSATILMVGYGFVAGNTNLTFLINGTEASEPIVFQPANAENSEVVIYGITTLAAGDHTVALRGVSSDITQGWLWVTVGEDTGDETIGVND